MSGRWTEERGEAKAHKDYSNLLNTTDAGEQAAQKMLSELTTTVWNERLPVARDRADAQQKTEDVINKYINTANADADKAADKSYKASQGTGYNLKFEIVDDNHDGKWNVGEKVQVYNESKYRHFGGQPEAFDPMAQQQQKFGTNDTIKENERQARDADAPSGTEAIRKAFPQR